METILMSIHPNWCKKIFNGEKTIEVSKFAPKPPFKVVVYCTKDKCGKIGKPYTNYDCIAIWQKTFCPPTFIEYGGKVIGEWICDKVDTISVHNDTIYSVNNLFADKLKNMCLTVAELKEYLGAKNNGYAIGITAPKLYDKPKELGEFYRPCIDEQKDCVNCGFARKVYPDPFGDGKVVDCDLKIKRPPQSYMRIQCTIFDKEGGND